MKLFTTLFSALMLCGTAFAQIPNPGFESWTDKGTYYTPDGWDNIDSMGAAISVYTCEQGSPGYAGNHYLKLTSKSTPLGVAAGIALSGKIDFTTYLPQSGFAYTGRPVYISGEWKHAPAATTDSGIIAVALTKWTGTGRDTVAFIYEKLPDMVTTWTAFNIPLIYLASENPDTAEIYFSSSTATNAVAGSYLYVDTLAFTDVPTGVTPAANPHSFLSVVPNPSNGVFTMTLSSNIDETAKVTITNILGVKVKELTAVTNEPLSVQLDEPGGVYFINAVGGSGSWSEKVVVR